MGTARAPNTGHGRAHGTAHGHAAPASAAWHGRATWPRSELGQARDRGVMIRAELGGAAAALAGAGTRRLPCRARGSSRGGVHAGPWLAVPVRWLDCRVSESALVMRAAWCRVLASSCASYRRKWSRKGEREGRLLRRCLRLSLAVGPVLSPQLAGLMARERRPRRSRRRRGRSPGRNGSVSCARGVGRCHPLPHQQHSAALPPQS